MIPTHPNSLSSHQYVAYAAPYLVTSWLMAPLAIIQGIYAKYYGLPLTTIAAVILLVRLLDAMSDPLIGYFSDSYFQRTGSRKPFILAGGLLFIVSGYFLYIPPIAVDTFYFAAWFIVFTLAWTLFEIPHITWASELASTAKDKTKIYSSRNMAGYAGLICFYATPLLPFFEGRAITPDTLRVSVIAAGVLMLPLLAWSLKFTPNKYCDQSGKDQIVSVQESRISPSYKRQEIYLAWRALVGNRPFIIFITAYSLSAIGFGMWYGLVFIFVDVYLGMGDQFAKMFMMAFTVGVLVTPFWYKIANQLGKVSTWSLAMVLFIVCYFYTRALVPGETQFIELLILKVVQTLSFSCVAVMAPAMLSEICDYSIWKFGAARTATYFSVYTFMYKAAGAIASALGLAIAGWYGFDATATVHSETGVQGLVLAMTWIPLGFTCVALVFILMSPITVRRHAIIRQRLDSRAPRAVER